jgi:hypothetical protein
MKQMPVESFFLALGRPISGRQCGAPRFVQLAHREQRFGQLRLVQPVQKVALVLGRVQALEQLMPAGGSVLAHPCVVSGGNLFGTQAHGMVQKGLELDLGIAQHIGVGRAPGLVFAQEFGKHAVLVLGGKVDVLDLDAQHVGHGGGVHKVDVGRAVLAVVIIFPVLHEDADHLVALLLEQVRGHCGVHAAAQSHHHPGSCIHLCDYPKACFPGSRLPPSRAKGPPHRP